MAETLRGKPDTNNSDGTLRGAPNNDGTLRGTPNTDGTLRGAPNSDGTLRGKSDSNDGTLRGKPASADGGTLRGKQDMDKTARGPKPNKTARGPKPAGAPSKQGFGQNTPGASAPASKSQQNGLKPSQIEEFELNGVTYKVDGIISASTGEAEIYCLSKGNRKYALKLYYAGYYPEQQVIKALLQAQGTGFLVDVIEYGQWLSPTGENRDYELMPYYTGGDLKPGMMAAGKGDLKALALSMIMAVKTAHDHKILHRDIKPGNFMYTDDSRSQLILTDFGIASMFETDAKGRMRPLKTRAQFRTKIYAAPETYVTIDGEIQYDDVKSDYYSLGMTLLTLWMGEEPFAGYDERTLLRMKKGESGTLPIADDMPAEMQHMIKGLTVPNPDKRWGFDEFERWLRGEDVPVEGVKQQTSGLNILYSGSKNQTANTFEELVQYMLADRKLAKQYLYSGKISRWLADAGYPELQMQVDEFVNKTYPKNQDAGLMAVAYMLDGELSYEAPSGNKLSTNAEIAHDMVYHAPDYLDLIADPDSSLYVYFRAAGINYADDFVPVAKDSRLKAVWRMIFTLDPNSPFPLIDLGQTYTLLNTPAEMVDFYAKLPNGHFANTSSAYPILLKDDAFYIWLGHRDPALAGKLKSKMSQEKDNPAIYDYLFYLLDPARNYFYQKDQNRAFTFEQIAEQLNDDLVTINKATHKGGGQELIDATARIRMFQKLHNNRLYYYLKSKELYKQHFDYLRETFNLDSKDHRNQAGPYNLDIATYKAIKAFNGKVRYYFGHSDVMISELSDLDKLAAGELSTELHKGKLKAWLAVQYQEDPNADLSEDYAYEGLLAQYTAKLGEIDPTNVEAQRTTEALNLIEDNAQKCRSLVRQVTGLRILWCVLIALPLIAVAVLSIVLGFPKMAHTTAIYAFLFIAIDAAILLRVLQIIPGLKYVIQYNTNAAMGQYFEDHKWQCAVFYPLFFGGFGLLLECFGYGYGWIIAPVFCLVLLGLLYHSCIGSMPLMAKQYDDCMHPDDEALVIEPLYYGWKDKDTEKAFESETMERQEVYIENTKDERNKLLGRTLMGLLPVAVTVIIYAMMSPMLAEWIKVHEPERYANVYLEGDAIADGKSTSTYYADVKNSLTVRAQPSKSAAALGTLGRKQEMEVISIDNNTGFAEIKWNDGVGYVSASYIKPVKDSATAPQAAPENKPSKETGKEAKKEAQAAPTQAKEAEAPSAPAGVPYVVRSNYSSTDFYVKPVANAEAVIGTIHSGETFNVISEVKNSQFVKVNYKGQNGYVMSHTIQKAE